jgi:hypothetical protein
MASPRLDAETLFLELAGLAEFALQIQHHTSRSGRKHENQHRAQRSESKVSSCDDR